MIKVNPYLSLEKINPGVSLMIDEASLITKKKHYFAAKKRRLILLISILRVKSH